MTPARVLSVLSEPFTHTDRLSLRPRHPGGGCFTGLTSLYRWAPHGELRRTPQACSRCPQRHVGSGLPGPSASPGRAANSPAPGLLGGRRCAAGMCTAEGAGPVGHSHPWGSMLTGEMPLPVQQTFLEGQLPGLLTAETPCAPMSCWGRTWASLLWLSRVDLGAQPLMGPRDPGQEGAARQGLTLRTGRPPGLLTAVRPLPSQLHSPGVETAVGRRPAERGLLQGAFVFRNYDTPN